MRKTSTLVWGGVLVLVGVLGIAAVLALQALGPGIDSGCCGGFFADDAPPGPASGVDAMFIQAMIPHHDDAIAMTDLALTRAEHPELKALAEDIKRTQTAENAQMREWYEEWFDAEVPEGADGSFGMMGRGMGSGMMGGAMTDLEALEEADSFDREFIEQMVPHHEMAIMMSSMLIRASSRPEMREFGETIIETQSAEIDVMLEWYEEWYGR